MKNFTVTMELAEGSKNMAALEAAAAELGVSTEQYLKVMLINGIDRLTARQ